MAKSIPDRWLEYSSCGTNIKGTSIIAFKVPLKETISKNIEEKNCFTIPILLKKNPKIKYVIDLTNTNRYYNPENFRNVGIGYEKIMIPGRQIPPKQCILKFFNIMDRFLKSCKKGELVGVHCTHGVNRTGYLICRYLIERRGWDCKTAMQSFAEARGHAIEREIYLNDLKHSHFHKNFSSNPSSNRTFFPRPPLPPPPHPSLQNLPRFPPLHPRLPPPPLIPSSHITAPYRPTPPPFPTAGRPNLGYVRPPLNDHHPQNDFNHPRPYLPPPFSSNSLRPPFDSSRPPFNSSRPPFNSSRPPFNSLRTPLNSARPPLNSVRPPLNMAESNMASQSARVAPPNRFDNSIPLKRRKRTRFT